MASGTRGYSSYRGRGSGWKILLAVLLVGIILASAAFILAQDHMTYDAQGNLHFQLPWAKGPAQDSDLVPDPDLVIQEPEPAQPAFRRGAETGARPLTEAARQQLKAEQPAADASAVILKDSSGKIWFDSAAAVPGAVQTAEDTAAALHALTADGYTIARISCFHDPKAANADVAGMGLQNTGGYIFYDGKNSQWLDPGKPAAREYLIRVIQGAAALGFDEILLTDVSYPTEGKLDKIDRTHVPESDQGTAENLETFLKEVRSALPETAALSLELAEETIRTGENTAAGQRTERLAPLVDRIYARTDAASASDLAAQIAEISDTCGFVPELSAAEPEPAGVETWLRLAE